MVLDHKIPTDIRVENEADILVQNGFEVGILSIGDYEATEDVYQNGYTIHRVAMSRYWLKKMHGLAGMIPWMDWVIEKHIKRIFKSKKYDALHFHDLYTFGVIQKLRKTMPELYFIGDMHENYVEVLKDYDWPNRFPNNLIVSHKKWEKNEKEWLPLCDKVITVSEGIKERLISKGVKRENAVLTPNSIRLDLFDSFKVDTGVIEHYKNDFVLLYVGGFIGNRGLEHVIKATPSLKQKIPNLKLVLVGDGEERKKLEVLVQEMAATDTVIFEGWKKQSEVKSYLLASDIGLVPFKKTPQTDNSSSNKLFQYMYYKLPIVATNCDSVEKLVTNENCGLIYESENSNAFTETVFSLYNDEKLANNLGKNGYNAVVEKYNWLCAAEDMLKMYKELKLLKK